MRSKIFLVTLWLSCAGLWVVWFLRRNSHLSTSVSMVDQSVDDAKVSDSVSVSADVVADVVADKNADCININTGSFDDLVALPGIGKAIAKDLIEYRLEKGPFTKLEDLNSVKGLGPSKLDKLKNLVCF